MSLDRRTLLKGMALGSLGAPWLASPLAALAGTPPGPGASPSAALAVIGSRGGDAFVLGARAALGPALQVRRADPALAILRQLEEAWGAGRPLRVLGLLDDATAAPLLDLARSAGGRIPWLGQHRVQSGHSRHRLLTSRRADGCAPMLGKQLDDCGAGFTIIEDRADTARPAFRRSGPDRGNARPGQWAAGIGWLLARMGAPLGDQPPPLPSGPAIRHGSFVSFLIEPEGA